MKSKKGFTLVELIAVIAILAIIALIVVPVINTMLKETRMNAFEDTAYGLVKAGNQYFAKKDLLENKLTEVRFEFPNKVEGLEISGELPESGYMEIDKKGNISLAISNGRYCATKGYNDTKVTVTEDLSKCGITSDDNEDNSTTNPDGNTSGTKEKTLSDLATTSTELGVTSVNACATSGICEPGTAFAIKVNDTTTYKFYVISDDNSKVVLIMDRNLGSKVVWISKIDYNNDSDYGTYGNSNKGPITALNYLNSQTSDWNNIESIDEYTHDNNLNGTTKTNGYQKLEIKNGVGKLTSKDGNVITPIKGISRARLITLNEVITLKTANSHKMPTYLYSNLSSSNTTEKPFGYWFLTDDSSLSQHAHGMYYGGNWSSYYSNYDSNFGVRPVIELSK